jgi:hypothetical protein
VAVHFPFVETQPESRRDIPLFVDAIAAEHQQVDAHGQFIG